MRRANDLRQTNPGRPSALTPDVQTRILGAITAGAYIDTALTFGGIDRATGRTWLQWGARYKRNVGPTGTGPRKRSHKKYAEFHDAVTRALADSELVAINRIGDATDWRAHAWMLERRHPARWGKREHLQLDGEVRTGADPLRDAALRDPEVAKQLHALLARVGPTLRARAGEAEGDPAGAVADPEDGGELE